MTCYDDAVRTIIDLPIDHLEALTKVCRRDRISRAEAIRRLLAAQLAKETADGAERAFGLWRGRSVDGVDYQERLRREWGGSTRRR
jgi:hypothetical protein